MAKKPVETVEINSGEKALSLVVKRYIPTVRIDAKAVAQLFDLTLVGDKLKYYPVSKSGTVGEAKEIDKGSIKQWAKLPSGWNRGNRPITPAHVEELAAKMADGSYHAWAGNMLVISDDPHFGGKSMCNSQHTSAAFALAFSTGTLHEKYRRGIELILVNDFTDDIVDLLDNAKQRTTADAIARRGLADASDAKIVQSVARFLTVRYKLGGLPTSAKTKVDLIDCVHAIQNDARFQPIKSVLDCLAAKNALTNPNTGKAVSGSAGVLTKKVNPKKPEKTYRRFGLPYAWWTLAGTILVNGGKCDPAEYAAWCHKIGYADDKSLNVVEMALREGLEVHGKQETSGTHGHWAMCQAILLAWGLSHKPKMPTKPISLDRMSPATFAVSLFADKERATQKTAGTAETVGMFWQDGNDLKNTGKNGEEVPDLSPFTFGTDDESDDESETEVDPEMFETEDE
jgi:hypothetical protein